MPYHFAARRFSAVVISVLIFAGLISGELPRAAEINFYVGNNGADSNSGSKEQPFLTLSHAQAEIRKHIGNGLTASVILTISGGTYELSEPLYFGPQDSGTEQHSITYQAAPGERVVVSGGRVIDGWEEGQEGRWVATLPDNLGGDWFFRQLVVDGQRATRARWPNEDGKLHVATVSEDVTKFTFDKRLESEIEAGHDVELVVYQNWSVTRGLVINTGNESLTTATPMGWIGHGTLTVTSPGKPAFLEHSSDFIDQPGEWFLDRRARKLHYLPAAATQIGAAKFVAPVLQKLISIEGTAEAPVRNLHLVGIRFEHVDFPMPDIGYNEIQAAHYGSSLQTPSFVQPVAIECTYAEDCRFENCRIAHVNCSGLGMGAGCRRNKLLRCTIEDIGGAGVMIGWRGKGTLGNGNEGQLDADWSELSDAPDGNTVSNCLIRRCGADSVGAPGIFVAFAKNTRIARNEIYDLPYTGISVGFRWGREPTSQSNCLVESNHIHKVMQKLADGGGIYTLGLQPGTVLRGNYIHNVPRSEFAHGGAPNNGIFLDEGSKEFLIDSNVVAQTSGDAVRFNQCQRDWHTWNNNYFGDNAATSSAAQRIAESAGRQP